MKFKHEVNYLKELVGETTRKVRKSLRKGTSLKGGGKSAIKMVSRAIVSSFLLKTNKENADYQVQRCLPSPFSDWNLISGMMG